MADHWNDAIWLEATIAFSLDLTELLLPFLPESELSDDEVRAANRRCLKELWEIRSRAGTVPNQPAGLVVRLVEKSFTSTGVGFERYTRFLERQPPLWAPAASEDPAPGIRLFERLVYDEDFAGAAKGSSEFDHRNVLLTLVDEAEYKRFVNATLAADAMVGTGALSAWDSEICETYWAYGLRHDPLRGLIRNFHAGRMLTAINALKSHIGAEAYQRLIVLSEGSS